MYKESEKNTSDAVHYNNQVFTTTRSEHFNSALLLALVCFIVGFFIPVSSLEVFGHSIHSERRIYVGK